MRKKKKLRIISSLLLSLMMVVTMVPMTVFAEGEYASGQTILSGEYSDSDKAWVFIIPDEAENDVVLDFDAYLDKMIRSEYEVIDEEDWYEEITWGPDSKESLPFIIKNESGKIYNYADTDFSLDMNTDEKGEEAKYYHLMGKAPYFKGDDLYPAERTEEAPFRSIVRTQSQPLQSLYGKDGGDELSVEQVVNVEEGIQAKKSSGEAITVNGISKIIDSEITTYAQYALWYYNTFYDAKASSLDNLPMACKLNLLGYHTLIGEDRFEEGNVIVEDIFENMTEEEMKSKAKSLDGLIAGKNLAHIFSIDKWNRGIYECVITETDPEIIKLGQNVLYRYGLRFTFDSEMDSDKVFFRFDWEQDDNDPNYEEQYWEKVLKDEGELGWSTLCAVDLDAETLNGDGLNYAQESIKATVGSIKLEKDETKEFDKPVLSMPGYAVVNAHSHMGAMKGLGLTVTLEAEDTTDPTQPTDPSNPTDPSTPGNEGNDDISKTGDNSNPVLWAVLMALAAAGAIAAGTRRAHSKK